MNRLTSALVVPLLALTAATACSDSTSVITRPSGTYTLVTVGGKPLPFVQFVIEGDSSIVLGSSYTFLPDSSFIIRYDYRYVRGDSVYVRHMEEDGGFRTQGDSLEMSDYFFPGYTYYARLSGRTLTVHGRYDDWVYRK